MGPVKYPLATSTFGDQEKLVLHQVVESGSYTMGPRVARFEREFAAYVGSRFAVMVNSGSSANLLMAETLRYRERWPLRSVGNSRPRIVVPAVSWATTYSPFANLATLVFVDVDRRSWGMGVGLADALRTGPDAVMSVNLLGNFGGLVDDVPHLEDNCEALGATYNGKQAGTYGLMGSFSFFFSHHISTMEGGMVVTDDEECYHILLSLRSHGWTRHLPEVSRIHTKAPNDFEESFKFILPGFNVRPGEIHGAVGLTQLSRLPEFLRVRRENATQFKTLMADYPQFETQEEVGESSWFGFGLVLADDAPWDRAEVLEVFAEHGIETRPIVAGNFVNQPVMKHYRYEVPEDGLPNAQRLHDRGFFIGNNPEPIDFDPLKAALDALVDGGR